MIKLKYNQNYLTRLFNYSYISIRFSPIIIYLFVLKDNLINRYNNYRDAQLGIESYEVSPTMRVNIKAANDIKKQEKRDIYLSQFTK